MILVFLGSPGSGKGTQAHLFVKKYNFKHLSTGDLIRQEIKKDSLLGKKIQTTVEKGEYVSDDQILNLVEQNLSTAANIILDGFPRTLEQAHGLDRFLKLNRQDITAVINFVIDKQIVIKRLSGRYLCAKCGAIYNRYFQVPKIDGTCDKCHSDDFVSRADDSEESIKRRLDIFSSANKKVIEFYQQQQHFINIDCNQSSDTVHDGIVTQLQTQGIFFTK